MSQYRWERDAKAGMPTFRWHRLWKHFGSIKKPRGWRRKRAAQIRVYMKVIRAKFVRVKEDSEAFFVKVAANMEPKP